MLTLFLEQLGKSVAFVRGGTLLLWVPFALVVIAAGFDLFNKREIPDSIPVLIVLWSLVAMAFGWLTHGWMSAVGGCLLGLGLGLVFFHLGGLGGADVKLIASLGTVFGVAGELSLLFYVAVTGAILALIAKLRGQREFAYVVAIAIGMFIVIVRVPK
jgi:prepilin peptidase CpaA